MKIVPIFAAALASQAHAQPIGLTPCHEASIGRLDAIAIGPNNEGIQHYYNGTVTVLQLDTDEPAAASSGFAVLMPSSDGENEPAFQTCYLNWGFTYVDVSAAQATYDPAVGLTLTIPATRYNHKTGVGEPTDPVRLLINAGQGTIRDLNAE